MNAPMIQGVRTATSHNALKAPCDLRLLTALEDALHTLSLTSADLRLLAFFPLVYVAWSDGQIQRKEADVIIQEAGYWNLNEEEIAILSEQWLACKPTKDFNEAGLFLIEFLFEDERRLLAKGGPSKTEILAMAERVARAAGGLFDLLFTLEGCERDALRRLRQAMHLAA